MAPSRRTYGTTRTTGTGDERRRRTTTTALDRYIDRCNHAPIDIDIDRASRGDRCDPAVSDRPHSRTSGGPLLHRRRPTRIRLFTTRKGARPPCRRLRSTVTVRHDVRCDAMRRDAARCGVRARGVRGTGDATRSRGFGVSRGGRAAGDGGRCVARRAGAHGGALDASHASDCVRFWCTRAAFARCAHTWARA